MEEDQLPAHELPFNGRTWRDMPGLDYEDKKLSFALYRRGLYDPDDPNDIFNFSSNGELREWVNLVRSSQDDTSEAYTPSIRALKSIKMGTRQRRSPGYLPPCRVKRKMESEARRKAKEEEWAKDLARHKNLLKRYMALQTDHHFNAKFAEVAGVRRSHGLHLFLHGKHITSRQLDKIEAAIIYFENEQRRQQ